MDRRKINSHKAGRKTPQKNRPTDRQATKKKNRERTDLTERRVSGRKDRKTVGQTDGGTGRKIEAHNRVKIRSNHLDILTTHRRLAFSRLSAPLVSAVCSTLLQYLRLSFYPSDLLSVYLMFVRTWAVHARNQTRTHIHCTRTHALTQTRTQAQAHTHTHAHVPKNWHLGRTRVDVIGWVDPPHTKS